ncbi:RlpA-like double-psi beta-barrel-protein domain-containing protein-containing protein, partial [Phlebopus sp. FC_14]
GACGITNGPNDFIVALNSAQYDDGAHCFASITITVNGKTAQAQITDECPGCAYGGLDFSQGLFQYFAPLSQGELYGSWYYNSEAPTSTSTTPTPTPTPTPTEAPTSHTPTWTSPPTTMATSTSTSTSISTSSSLSSSMSWTASSSTSLISASGSSPVSTPPPVPTFTSQNPQILVQIDLGLIELGSLLQTSLSF